VTRNYGAADATTAQLTRNYGAATEAGRRTIPWRYIFAIFAIFGMSP